ALRRAAGPAHALPRQALQMPFHRGRLFSLTFLGGLLVEFTPSELGEDARLFTSTLEATQSGVEVLILANTNAGHSNLKKVDARRQSATGARILRCAPIKGKGGRGLAKCGYWVSKAPVMRRRWPFMTPISASWRTACIP